MKIAFSKGSLLDNLEPFQIESIVGGTLPVELANKLNKMLLLSPPPPKSPAASGSSRRSSKTSASIQFRLEDAEQLLRSASSPSRLGTKSVWFVCLFVLIHLLSSDCSINASSKTSPTASITSAKKDNGEDEGQGTEVPPKSPTFQPMRTPPLLIALLGIHSTNQFIKSINPIHCICIILIATTGWIAFAAAVFCLWEDWSYFTSVYFFFISMSTIGFGDVTPQHPQVMQMDEWMNCI